MKQPVDVHMLSTDKKRSALGLKTHIQGNRLYWYDPAVAGEGQYLYFTTDEEIKEGDWYIDLLGGRVVNRKSGIWNNPFLENYKKIVATNNPELWYYQPKGGGYHKQTGINKIPDPFIKAYISAYNAGKPIKQVMLEYEDVGSEEWMGDDYTGEPFWNEILRLKLNPDGSVIWSLKEEKMYTRDEAFTICRKAFETNKLFYEKDLREWFNKNYPE